MSYYQKRLKIPYSVYYLILHQIISQHGYPIYNCTHFKETFVTAENLAPVGNLCHFRLTNLRDCTFLFQLSIRKSEITRRSVAQSKLMLLNVG